jgi:hypothetical protein
MCGHDPADVLMVEDDPGDALRVREPFGYRARPSGRSLSSPTTVSPNGDDRGWLDQPITLCWVGTALSPPTWDRRRRLGGGESADGRGCRRAGCPRRAGLVRCAVDLVDQAELEELTSDVGRENLDVLAPAASSAMRTASSTGQLRIGDALGLTRVLRVVGENKDGPSHAPPYGHESPIALSKPSRPASTAPVVSMYSACRPVREY